MKGFEVNSWYGLCAPGGTPKEIVNRLSAEIARAVAGSAWSERLRGYGMTVRANTPEQFAAEIRGEGAQWARIIKEQGIKAE